MTDLLTLNERPGAYPPSYYAATANDAPAPAPLDGDTRVDVCIVGGGFTGLSAAVHLAGQGLEACVVEAARVGFGASGRNGGQLGSGQRVPQRQLEAMLGRDHARALWDLAEEAKSTVRGLVADHDIACDLKDGHIHAELKPADLKEAHAEARHVRDSYGYDSVTLLSREEIRAELGTIAYCGGVLDMGAGHLHPLNLALGLARAARAGGVAIHELTRVRDITGGGPHRVRTDRGTITADTVLIAANGYHCDLTQPLSRHVLPINNYIVATEPLDEATTRSLIANDVAVADSRFVVNYFRMSADRRMLFGGGESYRDRFPDDIAGVVRPRMLEVYPQLRDARIDYAWGGTLGITISRLPFFLAEGPTRLSAGGFSGHGVALAVLAGKLMARYVQGATEGFDAFQRVPSRPFPGGERLRRPFLVLAMSWYAMRDRLGV